MRLEKLTYDSIQVRAVEVPLNRPIVAAVGTFPKTPLILVDITTKEGIVAAYIHLQGKVGVLVEVNCETDFVAKNDNFREFVKDITLHIAAAHPLYVTRDQVPAAQLEKEKEIYRGQVKGKPANNTCFYLMGINDGKFVTIDNNKPVCPS